MRILRRDPCLALCLALLVTLSGCAIPSHNSDSPPTTQTPPPTTQTTTPIEPPREGFSDPETDTIGWEGGFWHDEAINVTQDDGLTDAELDAYVSRAMARVEYLRNAEFTRSVNVTVKTREEYQAENPYAVAKNSTHNDWNNQVWEALFIVDEPSDVGAEFKAVTGASVLGYYAPASDELVIVSDSPARPTVDNGTLIHELTHALQDQRFNLSQAALQPNTQDAQLAKNGLVEGEAKYIENQYDARCRAGDWECVTTPATSGAPATGNTGIQLLMFQPYSDGPTYVQHLRAQGGWAAVDAAFEAPPTQTHQIIHPGTDARSTTFEEVPEFRNGWSQFSGVGAEGSDSVGEASVFIMLWYQNYGYGIDTIPRASISSTDPNSRFSYEHDASHGLVDDRLTPYRNGDARGYVWQMQWRTKGEATEFQRVYERLLRGHGGQRVADSTWVIKNGGYADAFYIERDGATLTIVNAPDRDALVELHPPAGEVEEGDLRSLRPSSDVVMTVVMTLAGVAGLFLLARKS